MIGLILILTFANESDKNKFDYIFQHYQNLLLHKAYAILHDRMLAEDAVSEALLRAYKNLHKIEDPASGKTAAFLVTIVRNVALTMLRQEKKHRLDELIESKADSFDLENYVVAELSQAQIFATVERLSEDLRSVFILKYAYDLPHKEIGRLLAISENNVTVRLFRAKKKLAAILVEEGYAHAAT